MSATIDPRILQILFLGLFLGSGAWLRDFSIRFDQVALTFASAIALQWLGNRLSGKSDAGLRSSIITAFGLSLLLRADSLWAHPLAAAIAISAKFLIRPGGKHLFNPANLGVIAAISLLPGTWVSSGQWGHDIAFGVWMVSLGALVTKRAGRGDISWAFLALYFAADRARDLWLGFEWAVTAHGLSNGALLLFAFFMISDPMTIPNARRGRVAHAALVVIVAFVLAHEFFVRNALLWALFATAPAVPFWDWLWRAERFAWAAPQPVPNKEEEPTMSRLPTAATALLAVGLALAAPRTADAFCGFYVAKADASLYNQASQVAIVRHDGKTVISMLNDYEGSLSEFALVVPVPVVLQEGQIHVGSAKLFDRLDAFTAPRLVEYHDPNPCHQNRVYEMMSRDAPTMQSAAPMGKSTGRRDLGVTVEATYTVGEYDIAILSAKESDGLEIWLNHNGYRIPAGASEALAPYIRQDMKFFVAKVNLKEQQKTGLQKLRPLQFAFESPRFGLPIRLGTLNAKGAQDLLIYVLTKKGRVETTNYRTVKLPTGMDLPVYVKQEFADFYRAMFDEQVRRENGRAVFTEYFWNMGWCDPCAANPLTPEELSQLGVFWLNDPGSENLKRGAGAVPVVVTRLHVRYTKETFPEDLAFQETGDRQNFQGRYVLRHAWKGSRDQCSEAGPYLDQLRQRHDREAVQLATLTGWDVHSIRSRMGLDSPSAPVGGPTPWWGNIWK